jgi:kynurenine formamidase
MTRHDPTGDEIQAAVIARSNWGRWGADDQRGTINLITPEKRVEAARLVQTGRTVSLARPLRPIPGVANPPVHIAWGGGDPSEGGAGDWIGMFVHSNAYTHIDALSHCFGPRGAWNGKHPAEVFRQGNVASPGTLWGSIEHWADGIVTRGVLLDVPRHRGVPFVTGDQPVHASELEAIARSQRIEVRPGDALVVYGGLDTLADPVDGVDEPGLHGSCVEYFRDVACALVVWDIGDYRPAGGPFRWRDYPVHWLGIPELGLSLVDNALLGPLAQVCQDEGRFEFLFIVGPLAIPDGTGSPVNPLAVF